AHARGSALQRGQRKSNDEVRAIERSARHGLARNDERTRDFGQNRIQRALRSIKGASFRRRFDAAQPRARNASPRDDETVAATRRIAQSAFDFSSYCQASLRLGKRQSRGPEGNPVPRAGNATLVDARRAKAAAVSIPV